MGINMFRFFFFEKAASDFFIFNFYFFLLKKKMFEGNHNFLSQILSLILF